MEPRVKGVEPPAELFSIDPARVVGLTIGPDRLAEIRRERARLMRSGRQSYANIVEIYEELDLAAAVHRRLSCPVIDVTELSVEETAQRVIRHVENRRHDRQAM